MDQRWNGIYAAYMTGQEGQGFAMFVFCDGILRGADPLGVLFDGDYQIEGETQLVGKLRVQVPPGSTVVQGVSSGPSSFTYETALSIDMAKLSEGYFSVSTPLGLVNTRLERLRGIES